MNRVFGKTVSQSKFGGFSPQNQIESPLTKESSFNLKQKQNDDNESIDNKSAMQGNFGEMMVKSNNFLMVESPKMQRSLSNIGSPKSKSRRKLDRVFQNNEYLRSKSNFNEVMTDDKSQDFNIIQQPLILKKDEEVTEEKVDEQFFIMRDGEHPRQETL